MSAKLTETPQPAEPVVVEKSLQVFHLERELATTKAALSAAEQRAEAMEAYAARYEWLREIYNQGAKERNGNGPLVVMDSPERHPRYVGPLFGKELDKAIDAAIASGAGESGNG